MRGPDVGAARGCFHVGRLVLAVAEHHEPRVLGLVLEAHCQRDGTRKQVGREHDADNALEEDHRGKRERYARDPTIVDLGGIQKADELEHADGTYYAKNH